MRAATTNSAVSRFRCTGICPHKINVILGVIFASRFISFYFTHSSRGYVLQFWAIHSNVRTSVGIPSIHVMNFIIVICSWIFSTINNIKKWKHLVIHLWTRRLHLLRGLCAPHMCTLLCGSEVNHPTSHS